MKRYRALMVLVGVLCLQTGCLCQQIYRLNYKPHLLIEEEYEESKKGWVEKHGAEILWETSQDVRHEGITYYHRYVFYKLEDSIAVVDYAYVEGGTGLYAKSPITYVTQKGCVYRGRANSYEYGWAGDRNYAVRTRKQVTDTIYTHTNCGEYAQMPVWPHVIKIIPAEMAASAEEEGSVVLSSEAYREPSYDDW